MPIVFVVVVIAAVTNTGTLIVVEILLVLQTFVHAIDFVNICKQYRWSHHRGYEFLLLFYLNAFTTVILIICLGCNRLRSY